MNEVDLPVERILSVSSRRKILEELIKNGESTAYELAKVLQIPDSVVGKHLRVLEQGNLVEEPRTDISEGRLRKVYRPTAGAKEVLTKFWLEEVESLPKSIQNSLDEARRIREGGN